MLGVLLSAIGAFFEEVGSIIGRKKVLEKEETMYSMGFLHMFWASIFFLVLIIINNDSFRFSAASLPFFGIRLVLEIIEVYITLVALIKADRSTFGFIRTLSIPLLLLVDIFLGYQINTLQIIGVGFVIISMMVLFMDHNFSKKGAGLVLFGAVNSVATISLYKYDITHYNSVAAEQLVMLVALMAYLLLSARFFTKQNPFTLFKKRIFFAQSFSQGIGALAGSFAYTFAPASVIVAAKRSSAVLWATVSGNMYFHEKHILVKLSMFLLLATGIVLIII